MGFSYVEFSPHMYIRSSLHGLSRDPNRTLSNELLLISSIASYANTTSLFMSSLSSRTTIRSLCSYALTIYLKGA